MPFYIAYDYKEPSTSEYVQDLNALDAIDKEGAIQYALSEYEDYPSLDKRPLYRRWQILWRITDRLVFAPETCQGAPNLEFTFYAVKALNILNQCDALNREKTIHYVLSFQTRRCQYTKQHSYI